MGFGWFSREKKVNRLVDAWCRRQVNCPRKQLKAYARNVIDAYRRHANYVDNKLDIPFELLLAEVIRPEHGLVKVNPLAPLELIECYWFDRNRLAQTETWQQCCNISEDFNCGDSNEFDEFDEPEWNGLQQLALKTMNLTGMIDGHQLNTEPWNNVLDQEPRVKKLSVCYFAALGIFNALRKSTKSPDVVNCFIEDILCRKNKHFVRIRALLDRMMVRDNGRSPLLKLSLENVERSMKSSGGFDLAAKEGNACLFRYLRDCIDTCFQRAKS